MTLNPAAFIFPLALAEKADLVFFSYDLTTKHFTYLNPAFEKVWHTSRKSILQNPHQLFITVHPEDKLHVQGAYLDLRNGVLIEPLKFRIQVRNHPIRWISLKALLQEEPDAIMGYAQDITVQKDYNDYLHKFSDKKNAVLNILSHDLAGPLANIQNLSSLLAHDLKEGKVREAQYLLDIIQRSSQQGTQLIQEFLRQEFLEAMGTEVIKRRVNLVATVGTFLNEYQQTQQITGKTFHYLPGKETIYLELDDNKFIQVLNNLISNSLKFTPDGGEISITLEEKEATVLIQVTDTGIGIPAKYHSTLFEKFTKARRPGLKDEPSVGLGMSIIKTIVEWHRGHIWFESQENQGTTFYIEIPKS